MGRIVDGWRDIRDRKAIQVFSGADPEGLPELSDLMSGKPAQSGTEWERPPLSLLLYLDGSLVKFSLQHTGWPRKLWGSFPSLKDGLFGVEDAICKERCDWRKADSSENGFTHRR